MVKESPGYDRFIVYGDFFISEYSSLLTVLTDRPIRISLDFPFFELWLLAH